MPSNCIETNRCERRRVMHVINGEHYSGAERVQDLLAQQLPKLGFDVSFACVKPGKFAPLRHDQRSPIYDLPMRTRMDVRPALSLARLVEQNDITLLHAHTPRSLIVARLAAMISRVPLIYHVHSPTSQDSTRALRNWLNNTTERFSLAGVDRVICVSESLARHMQAGGIPRERIVTIPNGVPGAGLLTHRRTPEDPWTLGTVALFRPRKGLEILLESLAMLRGESVPVRLRAVGPFETPQYERAIHGLERRLDVGALIDWLGFKREVHGELAKMDVFVLPSPFGEGLPMVVLEAMAAGVPVVASRVEGVPEAVRDGVDGVLAEPGNVVDLARAIRWVVEHPDAWQRLRESAYRRHAEAFSDLRMAEQVAGVYEQMLPDALTNLRLR